jgi:DNA-binding NarL/FixJ family response regulator
MTAPRCDILIVEDHPLMRKAVAELLAEGDYGPCREAGTPEEALAAVTRQKPDVIIVDLSLGDVDGCQLIRSLKERHPKLPVLVFSMHADAAHVERAFQAGARGYVAKNEMGDTLLEAMREVLAAKVFVSPRLARGIARQWTVDTVDGKGAGGGRSALRALSPNEREVYRLFGQGYSIREIAQTLHKSPKTIETYCARIKEKLKIASNRELLRHAIQANKT